MKATAIGLLLAAGAAFGGVQLPEGYTRLEYVTIPADYKPNNGVVLEGVQWKDIGRIVGTFRCADTHSNQHMIFASTSDGSNRQAPYIALNGGQSTRVNGVTVTPAWMPDDTYAMDGVTVTLDHNYYIGVFEYSLDGWKEDITADGGAVISAQDTQVHPLRGGRYQDPPSSCLSGVRTSSGGYSSAGGGYGFRLCCHAGLK